LGQIWANPNVGLKNLQLEVKVEVGLKLKLHGLSIFYPNLDSNNPALFRVCDLLSRAPFRYAFFIIEMHAKVI